MAERVQINITDIDIDALARVGQREVDNIAQKLIDKGYNQDVANQLAYGSFVDTVLNRAASNSSKIFGGTKIQDILNHPVQFQPVYETPNRVWQDLSPARQEVKDAIKEHINSRLAGQRSQVGEATHYLNPTVPIADDDWKEWGQKMVEPYFLGNNPFDGNGNLKENIVTHIYGNANNLRPDPYTLNYDKNGDGSIEKSQDFDPALPLPTPRSTHLTVPEDPNDLDDIEPGAGHSSIPLPEAKPFPSWADDVCSQAGTARTEASPLVLDLDGDGVELTALDGDGAVYWDIDQDGMAEATGWVAPDDGLLVYDRNNDGVINDHSELFGTEAEDGFVMLSEMDSNGDGVINADDSSFANLQVWQDVSNDGVSQADELFHLNDLGITEINLNATTVEVDNNGNTIRAESTFTMNGETKEIVDAWFAYDNVNTVHDGSVALDVRTLFLPTARGYGEMSDLHIAMSQDETLLDIVGTVAVADTQTLISAGFDLQGKITQIMYRWAGVENADPNGRGNYVDGQELAFIEAFTAEPFLQNGNPDPWVEASATLSSAFNTAFNAISARIMIQAAGKELFTEAGTYNPMTDEFDGSFTVDLTAVNGVISGLNLSDGDLTAAWNTMLRLIDTTVGIDNMAAADRTTLETMITDSDATGTLTLQDVMDTIYEPVGLGLNGTPGDDTLIAGAGNDNLSTGAGDDTLYGRQGADSINGGAGDDVLYGEGGHDRLDGGDGHDHLHGGAGDDTLQGGYGNDTYYYDGGIDTVVETSGFDTIVFAAGITPTQIGIDYSDTDAQDLYIYVDGDLALRLENYFAYNGGAVEYLSFADGTVLSLGDLTGLVNGTDGHDTLIGLDRAIFPHDTIYAGDGDDTLQGGLGDDIVNGGAGDDTYIIESGVDRVADEYGSDTVVFGAGLNAADVSYTVEGDDLHILFNNELKAVIEDQFQYGRSIETLQFDDNVTVTTDTLSFVQNGNDSSEYLRGYAHGAAEDNTIYGNGGNDRMYGYDGDDILNGGDGRDRLYGGDGNDILYDGAGNDVMDGGTGDDILHVSQGVNTVTDNAGNDKIVFDAAYDPAQVSLTRGGYYGDDLEIRFGGEVSTTISHFFSSGDSIETLEFSDGSTLDLTGYRNIEGDWNTDDTLVGINDAYFTDDVIHGYDGDDSLSGGIGENTLSGGQGNDVYHYGGGHDTIEDEGGATDIDEIHFGSGIAQSDITLEKNESDLLLLVNGEERITLKYQFDTLYNQIENLVFDDGAVTDLLEQVYTLNGTTSNDWLYGTSVGAKGDIINAGDGNDTIYANGGDDILNGGSGHNRLYGGDGDDTFNITAGSTNDIYETGGDDTIVFDSGFNQNDMTLEKGASDNLSVLFNGTVALTLYDQFREGESIENFEFADGSTFGLLSQSYTIQGNNSDETLRGISYGGDPDDTIYSAGGFDTLYGYLGNDTLYGGNGGDTLIGGEGDDILIGNAGDDIYNGGLGDDTFYIESGLNTITDNGGNDTIVMDAGFTSANMTYGRSGAYDLEIYFNNTKTLVLKDQLASGKSVETLQFNDGSTIALETLPIISQGDDANDDIQGSDNPDIVETLSGGAGDDYISGRAGNDILYGGTGSDDLSGGDGNDTLIGNSGGDYLYGGSGDDTYIVYAADGNDTIDEFMNGGFDTLHFNGVSPEDIRLWTDNDGKLKLENTLSNDVITVYASTENYGTASRIGEYLEQITFDDGTTWDLTVGLNIIGDAANNDLSGTLMDDTLNGGAGDDYLYADDGDDIVNGGAGSDDVSGGAGNDTLIGGTGDDYLYGSDGDDTYIIHAGDGNDTIDEFMNGGFDTLHLADTVAEDIRLWTDNDGKLKLENTLSNDVITVYASTENYGTASRIGEYLEQITFDDGTTWDLTVCQPPFRSPGLEL